MTVAEKITRLVQEHGWSQERFARKAGLSRHTIRLLFKSPNRQPHFATIQACAKALSLSVHDLMELPIEQLVRSINAKRPAIPWDELEAEQPALAAWLREHPQRATLLAAEDLDWLRSLQGQGGPLTPEGVEHFVQIRERRNRLLHKVEAIAGTEQLGFLEQFVEMLYERIQVVPQRGEARRMPPAPR